MSIFSAPKDPSCHSDRDLHCQEAIEAEFLSLVDRAHQAGWSRDEVAAALMELAGEHFLEMNSDAVMFDFSAGIVLFGSKHH